MSDIIVRPGRPEDADHFAALVSFTAPEYFAEIFGRRATGVFKRLFRDPNNIFGYTHSYFMEVDGKVAGMTLFYDHAGKDAGIAPFVILLIRILKFEFFMRLGNLLKFAAVFAKTKEGDMYSSNSAIYPEFRGRGLGEKLFSLSEEKARAGGYSRIVVDVRADNKTAIALRVKLGYKVDEVLPVVKIGDKKFEYIRFVKNIGVDKGA
jgi:ribosomal protein S18 acetylase RimI-like enzyme